jgi:acetyltransferase-like isoleucine patch superfamily enzyme
VKSKGRKTPLEDPLEVFPRIFSKMHSLWVGQTYPFHSIGKKVTFHLTSKVYRPRSPRISLGSFVSLREYAWLNVVSDDPNGEPIIILEDNCHVGFGSIVSGKNKIHLERDVLIGQMVLVLDHNHEYEDIEAPVIDQGVNEGGTIRIGQGTWIGHSAAIISPRGDLTIGRNCVIASHSVVMRSIPDYSVVAGYPATIIRHYDPESRTWRVGRRQSSIVRPVENTAT